ncbi:hypothetical protein [Acetivibrio mesophilus]|uniref:Poly A polymerase head domain-containing protein n=1 Tax=Acetivibrio mesophilus TaxID=2487273 RepID=A0A4Q0I8W5_9FIRM|nr:hypothetical protein [Acetivibrio mesophilus]RXE60467.1 hypothetical protein EFD62_00575 [Acetivibrio mesophilus]
MSRDFIHQMNYIMKYYPKTDKLLSAISNSGETLLIGGALREFKDNELNKIPRDFDIVVDTDDCILESILLPYSPQKNRFGGYKVDCNGLIIDVWCLKNTWAFKENIIKCKPEEYSSRLQDTVFLNIDAIVYNLSRDIWYDDKYEEAMRTRILDIVLRENPQLALNIVRTILLKQKYSMQLSQKLRGVICDFVYICPDFLQHLMQVQVSHYKCTLINEVKLKNEIDTICNQ